MPQEILHITENKRGKKSISLPPWVVEALYKVSGIKSVKKRHVLKAVKAQFYKAIRQSLDDHNNNK